MELIGERNNLPTNLIDLINEAENSTINNQKLTLILAFNYGFKTELKSVLNLIFRRVPRYLAGTWVPRYPQNPGTQVPGYQGAPNSLKTAAPTRPSANSRGPQPGPAECAKRLRKFLKKSATVPQGTGCVSIRSRRPLIPVYPPGMGPRPWSPGSPWEGSLD